MFLANSLLHNQVDLWAHPIDAESADSFNLILTLIEKRTFGCNALDGYQPFAKCEHILRHNTFAKQKIRDTTLRISRERKKIFVHFRRMISRENLVTRTEAVRRLQPKLTGTRAFCETKTGNYFRVFHNLLRVNSLRSNVVEVRTLL